VRDFTYIDDVVEAIMRLAVKPATPNANWSGATPDPASSDAPYCIYNLGNSEPIELMRYIHAIETAVGKPALLQMLPMQSGDVLATSADIARLEQAIGFRPRTRVEDGVAKFVTWYRAYYKV
jgi:UDP-glucuronate 4-epimerase